MFSIRSFLLVIGVMFITGCLTSTRVSDSREPEIQITASGEILFEDQVITKEDIPSHFKAREIRRDETIFILVPSEAGERDPVLMKAVVATLKQAGYGRTIFTTHRKAISNLK
jgi:biopolymer transport protein ExbD